MEMALLLLVPIAVIGLRLLAGRFDHDRVREYIESRGGRVIEARWSPFGPGWFGDRNDRIYKVRYRDRQGNEHIAHCKTSMWSGVYFTEDRIARAAEAAEGSRVTSLEEENRRLREEIDRLGGGRG